MSSEPRNTDNSTFHHTWPAQGARRFGFVNWVGLWTLYLREIRRFWKVVFQTVGAPVVTTLLFLAIFSLALGGLRPDISGTPFTKYLAPGLVIMAMLQNAFANTSSSLLIGKKINELNEKLEKHIDFIDDTYEGLKNPIKMATRFFKR